MTGDLRDQLQEALGAAYTLERELGGGGMSRVFLARETRFQRKVVVKVLSPDLAGAISSERFEREIQLAASLQQANIVPVLSAGETNGVPYFTMPYVEGESLRARLAKSGALPIPEVISVMRDVARALAYAHERGVVHRDIKPDNVLLSGATAVVTDFGIAKAISAAGGRQASPSDSTLTQMGTSLGSPAYMAPEQVAGDPSTDQRADIYAYGCMAYELLAGQSPFANRTPQRVLVAHMTEQAVPVAQLRPDTPPLLAELVMRCLAKEPSARPQSARDVIEVLDVVAGSASGPVATTALAGPGATGRTLLIYIGASIAALVVAKAAEISLGLPGWVITGVAIVMALGLPVILFAAFAHRVARGAAVMTPAATPSGSVPIPTHGTMATLALRASPHLRHARILRWGGYALGAFIAVVGTYLGLAAAGIGPGASLMSRGKFGANQRILVARFDLKGSTDSLLADVVSEAVRTDLSESRVVTVVSGGALRSALQRMERPVTTVIDSAVARDIAQREGIPVLVAGDITQLAGTYVLGARLLSAETGDALASFRATAKSADEIIPAVESMTREMREKIGESLKSVRATPALDSVTTGSLEALKKYAAGVHAAEIDVDYGKAVAFLRDAVKLDTTFAMAWRKLAVSLNAMNRKAAADSAATKAYEYRERLTERERGSAVGYYYQSGPGRNRAKALEAYEEVVAKGATDASLHNMALLLSTKREFARAESLYRKRITSGDAPYVTYANLVSILFREGKIRESDSLRRVVNEKFPSAQPPGGEIPYLYLANQLDSIDRLAQRFAADTSVRKRAVGWYTLGRLQMLRGQLELSKRSFAKGRAADSVLGAHYGWQQDTAMYAYLHLRLSDDRANARRAIDKIWNDKIWMTMPPANRPYAPFASFYAEAGDPVKARSIMAQWEAVPRDSIDKRLAEPARHSMLAFILMAEGKPLEAVKEFRLADMQSDGPDGECVTCVDPWIGRAFDAANMPDSAIVYFEHYLAGTEPDRFNSWERDISHLPHISRRLGELYEAKGERVKAAAYYNKFVTLWDRADPVLQPQVAEVKKRLARLVDPEKKGR